MEKQTENENEEDGSELLEEEEEDEISELQSDFEKATEFMKSVAGTLDKNELLYFYARFKQATTGKCNIKRPGMFDFQGKHKWDAWNSLKDMSTEQAMAEYITAMDEVDPDWLTEVKGQRSSTRGLGVGVSTMMADTEEEISDEQKSVFDWCKEGNTDRVCRHITQEGVDVNVKDGSGLTLLHWACDRGHLNVVQLLLARQADINAIDDDGQTPLHYACTCEHLPIIEVLVKDGADVNARDVDNNIPSDNTYKKDIHNLLETAAIT